MAAVLKDPGSLRSEVYEFKCGGIIPSIMDYTMTQAPRPNRTLALAGALTMTAHIAGRRYIAEDGTSPNLYVIALANSGCGKDFPRKVNRNIAVELGMVGTVCDSFASGGGLEDAVLVNSKVLAQYDEIDTLFRAMKKDSSGSSEPMSAMMLSLYGDSGSSHSRRQLSVSATNKTTVPNFCINPSLSIFGTAVPNQFFDSMSDRMMTNGLFARCIILPAEGRQKLNSVSYSPFSTGLVNYLRDFGGCVLSEDGRKVVPPKMSSEEKPEKIKVMFSAEVRPFVIESGEEYDEAWNAAESDAARALLARAQEKVVKLSLVFALSRNHGSPEISLDDFLRARQIVNYSNAKALYLASIYCADSDFHNLQQRVLRLIGDRIVTRRSILRSLHIPVSELKDVVESLIMTGEIAELPSAGGGVRYQRIDDSEVSPNGVATSGVTGDN